jgi:ketosteroid isomerase-like protein
LISLLRFNLNTQIKNQLIMKNKVINGIVLSCIILFVVACSPKKAEPVTVLIDKEQVKKEIQAIEDKFAAVYAHRNVDSLTYYADDAVSYFVGQKPVTGKDSIHRFIQEELMYFPEGAILINETLEIFVTDDGNNVAEIGAYKMVDSAGVVLQNGHYFSFFAKRNAKYVCTRDMATSHPVEN